jgi:geranylgeranyl pyrophosphate synthase
LGSDVIAQKQTALTLMAQKKAQEQWSEFCQRSEGQSIDEKLTGMRTIFKDTGVYAETTAMAEEYFNNAVGNLAVLPGTGREELVAFTNFIKNRNY